MKKDNPGFTHFVIVGPQLVDSGHPSAKDAKARAARVIPSKVVTRKHAGNLGLVLHDNRIWVTNEKVLP